MKAMLASQTVLMQALLAPAGYDATSTYFERQANGNELAKRGYSRDHRSDCKQVCIALVAVGSASPAWQPGARGHGRRRLSELPVRGAAGDRGSARAGTADRARQVGRVAVGGGAA